MTGNENFINYFLYNRFDNADYILLPDRHNRNVDSRLHFGYPADLRVHIPVPGHQAQKLGPSRKKVSRNTSHSIMKPDALARASGLPMSIMRRSGQ